EMIHEIIERRTGVVVQRVKKPHKRLTGDTTREELVEERLTHEKEDQEGNKKQRGDPDDFALHPVVVNRSRKLWIVFSLRSDCAYSLAEKIAVAACAASSAKVS